MSFNEYNKDAERGRNSQPSTIYSQRFLLFRDVAFVSIILFHIASTIVSIAVIVTHAAPSYTHGYLGVTIFTGILTPILAIIGWRDHLSISRWTSRLCFEFGWIVVIMIIDFIVTVAHSSLRGANRGQIAIMYMETISMILYGLGLGGMILLHHRRFPQVPVWQVSVQSVQWLESSEPAERGNPSIPPITFGGGKIAPWQIHDGMQQAKLDEKRPIASPRSPDAHYVGAHPFWQTHSQRQAWVEDDMAYIVQRYGLDSQAVKVKPAPGKVSRHAKKPSIRDLEISRPMPVVSTVRRSQTTVTKVSGPPSRYSHERAASVGMYDRLYRGEAKAPPHVHVPSPTLDVPVDVESITYPEPAAKSNPRSAGNRSLGLASRTLVGTSRPKAKASRAYVDTSKPLPSPPAFTSDDSLASSDPSQGAHGFVMAMAHRVKISASSVRPLMVSTPRASEMPVDHERDDFSDLD